MKQIITKEEYEELKQQTRVLMDIDGGGSHTYSGGEFENTLSNLVMAFAISKALNHK